MSEPTLLFSTLMDWGNGVVFDAKFITSAFVGALGTAVTVQHNLNQIREGHSTSAKNLENKKVAALLQKELAKAELVAASSENRLLKTNLTITVARVRAATGKLDNARASLLDALAAAKSMGCLRCEFEARLALGEIESKSAQTTETRSRLAALEKDATAKGFLLVARKAAAAAKKNAAQTSVLRQFPS
jgi:hypothetical protein